MTRVDSEPVLSMLLSGYCGADVRGLNCARMSLQLAFLAKSQTHVSELILILKYILNTHTDTKKIVYGGEIL